jgi:hypothetical protein
VIGGLAGAIGKVGDETVFSGSGQGTVNTLKVVEIDSAVAEATMKFTGGSGGNREFVGRNER